MKRLRFILQKQAFNYSPFVRTGSSARVTLRLIAGLVALFFLGGAIALSQQESGQISGTVTDQSGAVVPGAQVTVTNTGTNASRTAVTSAAGTYQVTGLQPATYQVVVRSGNFKPYSATIEVTVGARATLDAKLSIDNAVTQVEVIAEGGAQVNTQSQEVSQVVSARQVATLPSLTRNPYDFVAISGNISNGDSSSSGSATGQTNTNTQNATTRGVGFNINGQRSTGTEILLDGVENVSVFSDGIGIFVPLDAMQEFRVATSNFEPQFGRASGGVVNVTTKGGSNAFHGNAWEYNRLSAYTSNTYANNAQGIPKGTYTRNQFGFTVGGPILKNKLFFFGSTEWIRVRSAAQLTAGVPTPQFLGLAASNVQDFFKAYSGNHSFNFVQKYTAAQVYGKQCCPVGLPATTPVFGTVSFTAPQNAGGSVPQNTYNIVGRFDYTMSDKTQMFFRYVDYKEVDQPGAIFVSPYSQYNVGETSDNQAYLLSLSHVFSPSFTSNTKLSFSRFNSFQAYDTSLQNVPVLIVSVNATIPNGGTDTGTPIQLPGFYNTNPANGGLPAGGPQNTSQINHDLNWLKGQHSVQAGVQLVYIQDNESYGAYAQATQQLGNNIATGLQGLYNGSLFRFQAAVDPKGALPCVQNPYTGALTPTASCSIHLPASSPVFARSNRFRDWAVYAQDSWKITPRFTGNYGVRYEYYGVQHNNNQNLDSNFYYGPGATIPQLMRSGQVHTVPNSPNGTLWNPTYGAVSPRIGFAYDVFGNGRDSIRGGWGIAYERNFGNVTFNVIQNPPNYAVIVVNNTRVTSSNAGPLAGNTAPTTSPCYPAACLPPTSLRHVDENIRTAQTQFWSLAVEHGITTTSVVSLQYVGARGVHLYDIKNFNGSGSGNAMLGDPNVDPVTKYYGLTRLNNQYSNVNNRGSQGASNYQGFNIQFQTTNVHHTGLNVVSNYTWSHALDNLSTTFSETNNAFGLGYTNPFNPAMDYGNGDLDVRHRWVIAPVYIEPYFKNQRNLMSQIAGGWQISGIYQVHTGAPFSYFDSTNNFSGYNFARYTTNQPITQHTYKSIPNGAPGGNSNSFVVGQLPAAASWGNSKLEPPLPAIGTHPGDPTKPDLVDFPDGISDWGPWPSNMVARNSFRGPGLWTFDLAVAKTFPIRENVNVEFRAEGFNILNHHNLFLQGSVNDVASLNSFIDASGNVFPRIIGSKGGIRNNGGANDERRFGQFALKINF